jgi:hypothetical protein
LLVPVLLSEILLVRLFVLQVIQVTVQEIDMRDTAAVTRTERQKRMVMETSLARATSGIAAILSESPRAVTTRGHGERDRERRKETRHGATSSLG